MNIMPFLLRGINLLGVESQTCPQALRLVIWQRLSELITPQKLESITKIIGLNEVAEHADKILGGQVRGRIVVDVNK
jgi:acrylyl-CoA reductase (NADPH)